MFQKDTDCGCAGALYAKELSHRAANALQHAIAAVHLSRRGGAHLEEAEERLRATAALHGFLDDARHRLVEAADQISDVCAAVVIGAGAGDTVDVLADLDGVMADKAALRPLLMIVAELVGNSVRHAFRDGGGIIQVTMRHRGMVTEIAIEDDGICAGWHRHGGQGGGIVDDLVRSLGGKIGRSVTPRGSGRVEIAVPSVAAITATPAGCA